MRTSLGHRLRHLLPGTCAVCTGEYQSAVDTWEYRQGTEDFKAAAVDAMRRATEGKYLRGDEEGALEVIRGKADLILHRRQTLDLVDARDLYRAVEDLAEAAIDEARSDDDAPPPAEPRPDLPEPGRNSR